MELKECYKLLGGDFDDVLNRLRREQIIEKFIYKFLDDASFSQLQEAVKNKNDEEAFRAAHTLKGICQNLSFTQLYKSSSHMTEALRACDNIKAAELFLKVKHDYLQTTNAIIDYKNSREETTV